MLKSIESSIEKWRKDLDGQGFLVLNKVLSLDELSLYSSLYEDFMSGKLDASSHRHDLGSQTAPQRKETENIT